MRAPPTGSSDATGAGTTLFALFMVAALIHGAWAFTIPAPNDWDTAYYRTVARHVADGDGATLSALWTLLWLPPELPYAADVHWMPVPSRVLVPGVLAWRAHGDQVATVLIAAAWAPSSYLLAARMGASGRLATLAGLLCATGLVLPPFLSTPDSVAIYGLVGTLALLAVADGRWAWAAACGALAALTRNDGFLLAPCLALGVRGWPAVAVAASGPLTAAMWHARNRAIVGPEAYAEMRAATTNVMDYENLVGLTLGGVPPVGLGERLQFVATEGFTTALLIWCVALPIPSIALWLRNEPWTRAAKAYWLAMPLVTQLVAPGVANSGSVFRSSSALFPFACAVAVIALSDLGRWSERVRGYHPQFLPGLLGGAMLLGSLGLELQRLGTGTPLLPPGECALLADIPPDEPVFSVHPLLVEATCDRPAVVLIRGMSAEQVTDLAGRYGIRHALVRPDDDGYAPSPRASDVPALLPGWVEVKPRLYAAPPGGR